MAIVLAVARAACASEDMPSNFHSPSCLPRLDYDLDIGVVKAIDDGEVQVMITMDPRDDLKHVIFQPIAHNLGSPVELDQGPLTSVITQLSTELKHFDDVGAEMEPTPDLPCGTIKLGDSWKIHVSIDAQNPTQRRLLIYTVAQGCVTAVALNKAALTDLIFYLKKASRVVHCPCPQQSAPTGP